MPIPTKFLLSPYFASGDVVFREETYELVASCSPYLLLSIYLSEKGVYFNGKRIYILSVVEDVLRWRGQYYCVSSLNSRSSRCLVMMSKSSSGKLALVRFVAS